MNYGSSGFGQSCYSGIAWTKQVEPSPPPVLPEVPLGSGGGTIRPTRKKAFTKLQSAYIDYVRQQQRFDEEFARLDELEAKEKPRVIEIAEPVPPKITKVQFEEVAPVILGEFPGIGFKLPGKVKEEYFLPKVILPPLLLPKTGKKGGRELSDDEIWFLLEEDVL